MAVTLTLRAQDDDRIIALLDGRPLASTPLASLPILARLQVDPLNLGRALYAALGGEELCRALDADDERLLLLDADKGADAIPWEFAALPDNQFFAAQYGMLRLLDIPTSASSFPPLRSEPLGPETRGVEGDLRPARAGEERLNFVALAADPLVDENAKPREGYRLDVENEMGAIREALKHSEVGLTAQRVPPTQHHLRRALRRGPAILHLTCHGSVINTDKGPMAVLLLEDDNGKVDPLLGRDLVVMPP
jgi:CHAT domain